MGVGSIMAFQNMLFVTQFWDQVVSLRQKQESGRLFPYFLQTVLIFSTRIVLSCGLYILIIFCKQAIAAWRQRLWIDDSDWNESGCFVTALAFNISNFYFKFCSYQFVIKLSTTLAIIMLCDLVYVLSIFDVSYFTYNNYPVSI